MAEGSFGHMDGDWWPVMMLGMVLFWVLVVGVIVWLVRDVLARSRGGTTSLTPLEILDRRFAEGSIGVDEYAERREALRDSSS